MVAIDPPPVVSNTGPIIHLDELGCLDLLADFGTVLIPPRVWAEAIVHRPHLAPHVPAGIQIDDCPDSPSPQLAALADALALDAGERAALVVASARSARLFLTDDAAARLAAESLGMAVHGTLGIAIRSIRRGLRSRDQVLGLLRALPERSSLHISRQLLASVIATVERG